MSRFIFIILLIFYSQLYHINCAKILVLHPLHSGSHKVQLGVLSKELIKLGHKVTTISFLNTGEVFEPISYGPNITNYVLTVDNSQSIYPYITPERNGRFVFPIELFWEKGHNPHYFPLDAFKTTEALCKSLLGNHRLREELTNKKFDAAIVDLISNECGLGLVHDLGIETVIGYWALYPISGEIDFFPSNYFYFPSLIPNFLSKLTERMNFLERLYNSYLRLGSWLIMQIQFYYSHKYMQKYLSPQIPHPQILISNMSGVLINSDHSLDYPNPLAPNAINVGCLQCREIRPLNEEMEKFASGAKSLIVFSMGASLDTHLGAKSLVSKLIWAFGQLEHEGVRVIMKGQVRRMSNAKTPSNLMILDWIPQYDLLGHPNTKLFFSHCGLHGTFEAIWNGVPIVALPIFGDQFDVLARLLDRAVAVELSKDATAKEILWAIRKVLGNGNSSYSKAARRLQSLVRDQKEHPMTRAVFFVEYLIRHRGAEHLKSYSRNLTSVQLYCVDILIALFLIVSLLIYILLKILSTHRRLIFKILLKIDDSCAKVTLNANEKNPLSKPYKNE